LLASLVCFLCFSPGLVSAQSLLARASFSAGLPSFNSSTFINSFNIQQRAGVAGDSDGDSVPDVIDVDDDNDTIPDDVEGTGDTDMDGVADCLDTDSDNDGITDLIEAVAGSGLMLLLDADRNGRLDSTVRVGENGLANVVETPVESSTSLIGKADLDGDGIPNHQDLDVDNDGIPDVLEAGSSDELFDGRLDVFVDVNGDGLADQLGTMPIEPRDSDQNGIEDFRDLDADGDGLSDRAESFGTDADANGDGQVDNLVDTNMDGLHDDYQNLAISLPDTDEDGLPDFRDTDSNGDGVTDTEEAFGSADLGTTNNLTTPFKPGMDAQNEQSAVQTGENGSVFGCNLSYDKISKQPIDLVFVLLLGASVMVMLHRTCLTTKATKPISCRLLALPAFASIVLLLGCATPQLGNPVADDGALRSYAGIGVGASFLNADTSNFDFDQVKTNSLAGQFTLGLLMDERLSVEARAADLGEATFNNGGSLGYQVADISGLYRRSSGQVTGFARLGVGALYNDGDVRANQKNKLHVLVGFGADYDLNSRVALRAEWQGHDADVMHGQFSVLYRFGAKSGHSAVLVTETNDAQNGDQQKLSDSDFQAVPDKSSNPEPVANTADTQKGSATAAVESEPVKTNSAANKPTPTSPVNPKVADADQAITSQLSEPETETGQSATTPEAIAPNTTAKPPEITEPEQPAIAADQITDETKADSNTADGIAGGNTDALTGEPTLTTSDEKIALVTSPDKPNSPESQNPLNTVPSQPGKIAATGDADNDGVEDALDKCPGTNDRLPALANGCSLFEDSVPGLTFVPDTDRLTKSGEQALDTVAEGLAKESDLRVTVAVHTAPADDANEAMFLTRRRTIAIIRYLSNKGIDATRLRPEAYGDTRNKACLN